MKMHEDYIITDNEIKYKDKDVVASIKIVKGEHQDVEFHFGEIHVNEDEANGTCTLSFNYDIISDHKELESNPTFEVIVSEIMNDILTESLNAAEQRYKDELREKNSEAPSIG